jgi:hypothetical protein
LTWRFLGRKAFWSVLPKISSALAQLIKPIAPRAVQSQEKQPSKRQTKQESSSQDSGRGSGGFQRFEKESEPASAENPLENKVLPFPLKASGKANDAPVPVPEKPRPAAGLTDALLQLKAVIQEQSAQVSQWVAGKKYNAESQAKKKQASGKKGAIVDHKAE